MIPQVGIFTPRKHQTATIMLSDNDRTRALLQETILPLCQYFAYLEVAHPNADTLGGLLHEGRSSLWATYAMIRSQGSEIPDATGIASRSHIPRVPAIIPTPGAPPGRRRNDERLAAFRRQGLGLPNHSQHSRSPSRKLPMRSLVWICIPDPDRGHHGRANARRLCVDGNAAVLPALVVRQAISRSTRASIAWDCRASPMRL